MAELYDTLNKLRYAFTANPTVRGDIVSTQPHPSERRLVLRLLDYWRQVCRDRTWPAPDDFYPAAIPDLWDYCFLIDLAGGANGEPTFRYVGDYHKRMYGEDVAGVPLSKADPATLLAQSASYLSDVVRRGVPVTCGGEFTDRRGYHILYRSIMLPLSLDNRTIEVILGGANCRETAPGLGASE